MSDFHVIKYNGHRFSSVRYNQFHEESLVFLNQELSRTSDDKIVVVTHHVPTFMNYPEKHKGDILNEAFAVELFDLIENKEPDFWIYGHTHGNSADFNIGKTQLLTNQLGYVKYDEHIFFNGVKTFTL